jgi:hypothetical protein
MEIIVNNPSAFPARSYIVPSDLEARHVRALGDTQGMTLRDYFAAAAITGLCSAQTQDGEWRHGGPEGTAREAYLIADAMLAAREPQLHTPENK